MTNEMEFTERELIEFLINQYEYVELEGLLTNRHLVEKGYLLKDNSYKSFIKRVDTICETFENPIKKKGQPAKYILKGLKENPSPIKDGRKLAQLNDDDELRAKYFYNQIYYSHLNPNEYSIDLTKGSRSITTWAKHTGGIDLELLTTEFVSDVFGDTYFKLDEKFIHYGFSQNITRFNTSYVKKSIKILENSGYIKSYISYAAKSVKEDYHKIDKAKYDEYKEKMKKIINAYNKKYDDKVNIATWELKVNDEYANAGLKELKMDIKKFQKEIGIKMVWIAIEIELLKEEPFYIGECDFNNSVLKTLISNFSKLNPREKKKNYYSYSFDHVFQKYNYLKLLSELIGMYAKNLNGDVWDELEVHLVENEPSIIDIYWVMFKKEQAKHSMPIEWKRLWDDFGEYADKRKGLGIIDPFEIDIAN